MEITIQIPDPVAAHLAPDASDLARQALEALAVESYRSRKLTQFQVSQLLGLSRIQTEEFLAAHVDLYGYPVEEMQEEAALLKGLRTLQR